MFVILLRYVAPMELVERHLEAHRDWLRRGYAAGLFVASGPKAPRVGGVILARGLRAEVEALVAADPFATAGIAMHEVIAFTPTMVADGFEGLAA
jgi:uncharacterized protein YciI